MTATGAQSLSFFALSRNDSRGITEHLFDVDGASWQVRNRYDPAAAALFDRHYSRRPASIGIGLANTTKEHR